jgi:hemoglobin
LDICYEPQIAFLLQDRSRKSVDSQASAARRNVIVADIVERTGIDERMIAQLVHSFYKSARRDPLIGPIFARHVADWDAHMARMCDFWSSVALMSGRYHGQPMAAHLPLPIGAPQFRRWLELFSATAQEVCPPSAAAHFVARAERIAESLQLGIRVQRARAEPDSGQRSGVRAGAA